jgi:hypothetical protein
MTRLPALENWKTTCDSLHHAAQALGEIRRSIVSPLPNALHLSLYFAPEGLTTGILPDGGEAVFDFGSESIHYHTPDDEEIVIFLDGHNQQTLLTALAEAIPAAQERLEPHRLQDDTPFEIDSGLAGDYASALYAIFTAVARFRARLFGAMTPVVLWTHHFDLSFLWFATNTPDEHTQPHFNFGFAPFTGDEFPRPYLYSYMYPLPEGMTNDDLIKTELPMPIRWHHGSWTGAILEYDELTQADNPEKMIESALEGIYRALLPIILQVKT